MNDLEALAAKRFFERFGSKPQAITWAPGRVNVIGEHTDYNDGYVLPLAIGKRIYAAGTVSGNNIVTILSGNLKGEVSFDMSRIEASGDWGDYAKGIVAKMLQKRFPLGGFNALFLGNLPIGAGVSSSAAMEVVVCYLLQKLFRFSVAPDEVALLCQQAEHEFAGTRCGIMDQFVSVMGREGNILFLDCRTLGFKYVPLALRDYVLVACDSRVERGLAASEYNRRRTECEQGVLILARLYDGVRALRDATLSQVEECSSEMGATIFRRCRHVVSENERVLNAIEAMRADNIDELGRLMDCSHNSLRDDYEVSCPQLDLLVNTARSVKGVLGSRLTGAGFGGSTISLVHKSAIHTFENTVSEAYLKAYDTAPRFFECVPSNGARYANNP